MSLSNGHIQIFAHPFQDFWTHLEIDFRRVRPSDRRARCGTVRPTGTVSPPGFGVDFGSGVASTHGHQIERYLLGRKFQHGANPIGLEPRDRNAGQAERLGLEEEILCRMPQVHVHVWFGSRTELVESP